MDLQDAGSGAKYLIRDRDGKYPAALDAVLADAGITIVRSGVRVPRMNAIIERWVRTCRRELLDRTVIWNQGRLLHALREYEISHELIVAEIAWRPGIGRTFPATTAFARAWTWPNPRRTRTTGKCVPITRS